MNTINLNLQELISEHEHLLNLLQESIVKFTKEYNEQLTELEKYKKIYYSRYGGINKIEYVMNEFKRGKLYDSHGRKVTNPKQALAIAMSEQRKYTH